LLDGKVNILGALERPKFKIPNNFKSAGNTISTLRKNRILVFGVTLKQMSEGT